MGFFGSPLVLPTLWLFPEKKKKKKRNKRKIKNRSILDEA